LRRGIGLQVSDASLAELARAATELAWSRDPFDRLIAAHAIVAGAPLVTADQTILKNLSLATWS
jgi:PIN domain nuclease of toxin-antitoxin system